MQNFLKVDHFSDFRLNHFSGFRLISAISETVATMLKNGPFNHSIIKCKKKTVDIVVNTCRSIHNYVNC